MGSRDPRVDAYIEKSATFAKPILRHLRLVVHTACPDVEESVKWGAPHFLYNGMMCHMAAFKEHCAFGFWKGELVLDTREGKAAEAMGQFGRLEDESDLPSDRALIALVKKAMKLNEAGVKRPRARKSASDSRPEILVPTYLATALRRNPKARATFEGFTPGKRREYVEWLTEARTEATRERRLATAIEWMSEGKSRNWKYIKR